MAEEDVPTSAQWTHAAGTATISIRMSHSDIDKLTSLAHANGVPLSFLAREWILQHLNAEQPETVRDALAECDESYANLRRAIRSRS